MQQATNGFQAATAQYNLAVNHPTDTELAVAGAQLAQAQAALDAAKNSRQSITGDAPSRDTVIAFKDALEASKLFRYVDIDSTVTKTGSDGNGVGENFVISFSLEDGALK